MTLENAPYADVIDIRFEKQRGSRPCKFQLRVKATCIAEFGRPVGWSTNRARASSSETSDTLTLIRPGIASLSKTKRDRLAARRAIARNSQRML